MHIPTLGGYRMPIIRDASGRSRYVSPPTIHIDNPAVFFPHEPDEPDEYSKRLEEARARIIETIRFHERPLWGRGLNHEVHGPGPDFSELAKLVDFKDGWRARRLQKQRIRERLRSLAPNERRLRSPQDIKRRRSAIFGANDLPDGYFNGIEINDLEITDFIETIRRLIIEAAIAKMWHDQEMEYLNNAWYIKVSVLDRHIASRSRGQRRSAKVKLDDRSFHGKPNKDRKKTFAA